MKPEIFHSIMLMTSISQATLPRNSTLKEGLLKPKQEYEFLMYYFL